LEDRSAGMHSIINKACTVKIFTVVIVGLILIS